MPSDGGFVEDENVVSCGVDVRAVQATVPATSGAPVQRAGQPGQSVPR